MKHLLILFVKAWRKFLSPTYGQVCKYYPSCSEYGLEALQLHGAIKGSALTIWRILRCNPWSHGGVDPVPGSELAHRVEEWWPEPVEVAKKSRLVPTGCGHDKTWRATMPGEEGITR